VRDPCGLPAIVAHHEISATLLRELIRKQKVINAQETPIDSQLQCLGRLEAALGALEARVDRDGRAQAGG